MDTWDYFGQWYHGCDVRRPGWSQAWCVVEPSTCQRKPHPMSSMSAHGRIGGFARKLAPSQVAHENGDSWDYCSDTKEQLVGPVASVEDPLHACPIKTFSNVIFMEYTETESRCAQLCFNPSLEIHDSSLDLLYGTTCVKEGYGVYASTDTMNRQVVHWYLPSDDVQSTKDLRGTHLSRHQSIRHHGPTPPVSDEEHACEANRMTDAIHISTLDDGETKSCSQICLNPAFQKPAEKHGVLFHTSCTARGFTTFVKEDKNMGCALPRHHPHAVASFLNPRVAPQANHLCLSQAERPQRKPSAHQLQCRG